LPFDTASLLTIGIAATCLAGAALLRRPPMVRLLLIVVAALLIRVDPARQWSLHAWDEQLHALVAKHLIAHPLTPTLYEHPVLPPDPRNWTENHVWLHKPPLTMWFMAASMAILGPHAIAMRMPSVLVSALSVVLVYFAGRRIYDERVGLLAAGFQAVNALLVNLASGRRVADHVDTMLIACVEAGATAILVSSPTTLHRVAPVVAGTAMGAGLLAKSVPALLVGAIAVVAWFDRRSFRSTLRKLVILAGTAAFVAAPWMIYAQFRFPAESAAGTGVIVAHMTTVLDGAGGPWWVYLKEMPRYFGELVFIPVAWFIASGLRNTAGRDKRALIAWFVVPYLIFSVMPTKLPGFVAIAAPALFIIQAAFWCHVRDRLRDMPGPLRIGAIVLLGLLALLPARALLEVQGSFERRDRWPPSSRQFMSLEREGLPLDAVIFNVPRALEAMFYSPYTAYRRLPWPTEVEELQRRGAQIVIYVPAGSQAPVVPENWRARLLHEAVR
jgi:Dolichyl-phosphate-mannose-protein mannosyltransferase